MPEFFIFLLKINVALTLFCLAYYLILRKLTFYTLNRFFLLAGIIFSSLYPFIDPKVLFGNETLVAPITAALPVFYLNTVESTGLDYWLLAKVVFWIGVVFLSCRMVLRFYALYRVHQQSTPGTLKEAQVRFLTGDRSTFSFWRNIYLNPAQHQPKELQAVLEHEQVHVQEWHTVDILLAELTTVFYWFNPGVWYMKMAIQENVEFITDQRILQKGIDRKAYQYSMVNTLITGTPAAMMNHFNITAVKKRIMMMNSKRSSSFQLIRYVFLLPMLLILTSAFTLYKSDLKLMTSAKNLLNEVKVPNLVKEELIQVQDTTKRSSVRSGQKKSGKTQKKQLLRSQESPAKETLSQGTKEAVNETTKSARVSTIIINAQQQDTSRNTNIKRSVFMFSNGTLSEVEDDPKKVMTINGDMGKHSITLSQNIGAGIKTISTPVNYYINDELVSSSDFKLLDPNDIVSINVFKNNKGPKADGVWIYTKGFKKLK